MIVADGRLYMAGSKNSSSDLGDFYKYDAEDNKWISLQPMRRKARNDCYLVYLDGFIYLISADHISDDVQRYDMSQNRWDKVKPIPLYLYRSSVVAFKGRIFASVFVFEEIPNSYDHIYYYELLIYHPKKDMWQRTDVIKECDGFGNDNFHSKLFLFIHNEQCYRVIIYFMQDTQQLTVKINILDVQVCDDGEIICAIKDEIKQDPKPDRKNTFRIHNEVFVYDYKTDFVYNVGTMEREPELGKKACKMTSNVVMFTFDKRKTLRKPDSDSKADFFSFLDL